jgi:hypothetical protein
MSDRIEELEDAIRVALEALESWGDERVLAEDVSAFNRILRDLEASLIDDDTLITLTVRDEDRLS